MTLPPDLKPCPFCNERPRLTVRPNNAEATEHFAAVACYCGGYSACAHKMATAPEADEAQASAIAAWNRRAAIAAHVPEAGCGNIAAVPAQPVLDCEIQPRPLAYPLTDYHRAGIDGPLHYTWQDKPHRLLYDLIAAVRYYAAPKEQPHE